LLIKGGSRGLSFSLSLSNERSLETPLKLPEGPQFFPFLCLFFLTNLKEAREEAEATEAPEDPEGAELPEPERSLER
jgi:hypothetical protein